MGHGGWGDGVAYVGHHTRASHADNVDLLTAYGIATRTFRNMGMFRDEITMQSTSLSEGKTTVQYLGFNNFSKSSFDEMNEICEGSDFPKFTVLYDEASQILIVKIVAGVPHEACSRLFAMFFESKFQALAELFPIGRGLFGTPGRRYKQADVGYKPPSRRDVKDWPSVVFETGVSESLVKLRADAEFWLTSSQAATRVVIVLSINTTARSILIERWEPAIPLPNARQLRSVQCTQTVSLQEGAPYAGVPFLIPASMCFDMLPTHLGQGDYALTVEDLIEFNKILWNGI